MQSLHEFAHYLFLSFAAVTYRMYCGLPHVLISKALGYLLPFSFHTKPVLNPGEWDVGGRALRCGSVALALRCLLVK